MAISIAAVILQLLLASSTLLVVQFLWTYFYSPLKNIPGPFIAQFTNLWRFLDVWGGRSELTQKSLHDKYGAAVRLGPNVVSLNDPRLIKSIYSTRGEYLKVCHIGVQANRMSTVLNRALFAERFLYRE